MFPFCFPVVFPHSVSRLCFPVVRPRCIRSLYYPVVFTGHVNPSRPGGPVNPLFPLVDLLGSPCGPEACQGESEFLIRFISCLLRVGLGEGYGWDGRGLSEFNII
jgi:hypothetical protein